MKSIEKTMPNKHKCLKKVVIIVTVIILVLICAAYALVSMILSNSYGARSQMDRPHYTYMYDHYEASYPRKEVVYQGKSAELHGFIYGEENDKALVVIAHGFGAFHEDYLSTIIWLVEHGYCVFAPDFTGSGYSGGEGTMGLPQSAIDLDSTLSYIEADPELSALPKVLFGHSWGSYGVGAVLNYEHDVKAVVNVAGYNDPTDMNMFTFQMVFGKAGNLFSPFVRLYNQIHFGKSGFYTVVNGINKSNIPVLIVQGAEDIANTPDGTGIYAYRSEITNPYVQYEYWTEENYAGHEAPFFTREAYAALLKKEADLAELSAKFSGDEYTQKEYEYIEGMDKELMSSPNEEFYQRIDAFFTEALGIGD